MRVALRAAFGVAFLIVAGSAVFARPVASATVACAHATPLGRGLPAQTATGSYTGVRVPAAQGSVRALSFGATPATVGERLKIVWRVTGSGPLRVTFRDPDGRSAPIEGPTPHTASNFRAPGKEWGTVFTFDAPGCWTIGLARAGTRATVRIAATEAAPPAIG